MSSDVAPRLDSVYVEQTVGRLESRIRALKINKHRFKPV